jgi:hypothetical protein
MKIKKFTDNINEGMRVNTKYLMIPLGQEIPAETLIAELEETIQIIKSWECDEVVSMDNNEWIPLWR